MKITGIQGQARVENSSHKRNSTNPSFKSLGMSLLGAAGSIMQGVESRGYFASFLIQDELGMTAPRVYTGFHRDKEITGQYNTQEGLEVFGREGLTGPFIIAVAPAVLWFTGKFCKSTNTNTRLIKKFGESLKTMITKPDFDKSIQKDAAKFKKEFYKHNIESIYKNSIPNDKNADESIKYILSELEKFDSKDKKISGEAGKNIVNRFNEKMLETSSDLLNLNKVYVNSDGKKQAFNSSETIRALKDFANDAITNNKNAEFIDEKAAENIKNNFAAKRLITNISNVVLTLGGLSILPKLYARSDVSPGAKTMMIAQQQNSEKAENADGNSPVFKGKGINNDGFWAKLGKFVTKNIPDKAHELLEYTGFNFTKTTFALLATLGLLLPRGKRAWDRAQIDENGKRDMTEINEIIFRDTISSLSVVFAVPMLTKMFVKSYENNSGFILTNRASDGKNFFKKTLDVINPYSSLEVLSIADLDSIYGGIDSKSKLMNFANFVDKKGGDLAKILSKSENASLMFNEKTFTLESIKKLSKQEKNKKIISMFEKLDISDPKAKNEMISKLMKGAGNLKDNKIAKVARGLNSLPGLISTFVLSPLLLGYVIPEITYRNTRKTHEKMLKEKNAA